MLRCLRTSRQRGIARRQVLSSRPQAPSCFTANQQIVSSFTTPSLYSSLRCFSSPAIVLRSADKSKPASEVFDFVADHQVPTLDAKDNVLVRVDHVGVCYRDVLDRKGAFPFIRPPIVPGHEMCGEVVQTHASLDHLQEGDQVISLHWAPCGECEPCLTNQSTICEQRQHSFFGLTKNGAYQRYMAAPASAFVKVNSKSEREGRADNEFHLTSQELACVMCTNGTVYHAVFVRANLRPGQRVLVTGATGGVGSAAVRMIKAFGCEVVATTSSPDKESFLKSLGADEILVLERGKKPPRPSKPVDVSVECVGEPTVQLSLRSLKPGGKLVLIGNVTAGSFQLPLGLMIVNELSIIGADSITQQEMQSCLKFLQEHQIRPDVFKELSLKQAAEAHDMLESSSVSGRIVLNCGH